MKNDYRDMMEKIKAPSALKDRVLNAASAAQSTRIERNDYHGYKHKHHVVFRSAVCIACVLAILLVGSPFFNSNTGRIRTGKNNVVPSSYHFGLMAYAAGSNELSGTKGDKIAFSVASSDGGGVPGKGDYTGCLFCVTGDGIKTISTSIDRGGLYRYKKLTNLTRDDVKALYDAEAKGTLKADCQFVSSDDEKLFCSEQMTALGKSFTENWAENESYGFWVPPTSEKEDPNEDLREAAHKKIDTFNGATLTITATFKDGSQETKKFHLKTGKLKVVDNKDHTCTLLPELAADNEPYIYSVYAEIEK